MKTKIILIAVIGISIAMYIGYAQYNKPHRNIAAENADFKITCNQIFDDFENDEKAANEKYLDKVVEVSGSIIEINKDQLENTVLTLEAENAMVGGVLCTLKDKTIQFEEDAKITLKCRCTGFLMDVVLTDCTVVK